MKMKKNDLICEILKNFHVFCNFIFLFCNFISVQANI